MSYVYHDQLYCPCVHSVSDQYQILQYHSIAPDSSILPTFFQVQLFMHFIRLCPSESSSAERQNPVNLKFGVYKQIHGWIPIR